SASHLSFLFNSHSLFFLTFCLLTHSCPVSPCLSSSPSSLPPSLPISLSHLPPSLSLSSPSISLPLSCCRGAGLTQRRHLIGCESSAVTLTDIFNPVYRA